MSHFVDMKKQWRACAGALAAAALLWAAAPQAAQAWDQGWRMCATEGTVCRVYERGVVRYGVPGSWSTRSVRGDVLCSNEAFGDPAPNQPKRCEIAGRDHGGGGASGGGGSGSMGSDYVFCAAEGQTCNFRGGAEVRFGHGDRYTTRRAYGSVRCDVTDFGDPVYGVTKHCEVPRSASMGSGGGSSGGSWSGGDDRWRYCSAEGQPCRVNGRVQVRFGDGQRFATRTVSNEVMCDTSVFGDPAYGKHKHCEVQTSGWSGGWGGGSGSAGGGWQACAREGETCDVQGRAQVRYGASGRYQYRDAWGSVRCDNDAFGDDPYPGKPKRCEVLRR